MVGVVYGVLGVCVVLFCDDGVFVLIVFGGVSFFLLGLVEVVFEW